MKLNRVIRINNVPVECEIDTGSPIILIGRDAYYKHFGNFKLSPYRQSLSTASNQPLEVLGAFRTTIATEQRQGQAEIVVFNGYRHLPLLGVGGLDILYPDWRKLFTIDQVSSHNDIGVSNGIGLSLIDEMKTNFESILDGNITVPIKGIEVELHLKPDAIPVCAKARPIPYGMQEPAKELIQGLVSQGILRPVDSFTWASPIVLVKKPDGKLRLCIDPSRTLNPWLTEDHYPLPTAEDLFVEVGGHKYYTLIDLVGAFQQLVLTSRSSQLVVITTPFGAYEYTRLTFGLKTASAIFQREIDKILREFPWAKAYIDDIIIYADSLEEMRGRVMLLFKTLMNFNVKVSFSKCIFCVEQLTYLGHVISKAGISPTKDRLQEVSDAKPPRGVKELQSFLGLTSYVRKFVPRLSTLINPLNKLQKSGVKFVWESEQQIAFEAVKNAILNSNFLVHFNPKSDLYICTDASDVGIAAVLCHKIEGALKPIIFKSRTLQPAETRYPILHRELLAVVYGFEQFYKFVFGSKVVLYTDHQPLVPIVKKGNSLSTASTRIQRYLIRLTPYDLIALYVPGRFNALADFPSRFPRLDTDLSSEDREEVEHALIVNAVTDGQKLNFDRIREVSEADLEVTGLKRAIIHGDFSKFKQYSPVSAELVIGEGVITHMGKILIPKSLRPAILRILHSDHIGIVRMKQLARRYVFWPGINKDLEEVSKHCDVCTRFNPDRNSKIFIPWPEATAPFDRVHIDFFHKFGRTFLILVDANTRWVEVIPMASTTASQVLMALRSIFSRFGDPGVMVSDNGPPFCSSEFNDFCAKSDIKLIHSPPYHPQSNGLAERWVQTVKSQLDKEFNDNYHENGLYKILLALRTTPTAEGHVPADEIFTFRPRTALERLLPPSPRGESTKPMLPTHRSFEIGQSILLKGVRGIVTEKIGNVMYKVALDNGVTCTAHVNQLKKATACTGNSSPSQQQDAAPGATLRRSNRARKPTRKFTL